MSRKYSFTNRRFEWGQLWDPGELYQLLSEWWMNTRLFCSLRNADWGAFECRISTLPWICLTWTPSFTLTVNQLASQSSESTSKKCGLVAWYLVLLKEYTPAVHWTAQVCQYQGFILYSRPIRQGLNWYVGLKADWQEVDKITWTSPEQGPDSSVCLPWQFYSWLMLI